MKGITISYGSKSALISIDKEKGKALLSFRGVKKEEFALRSLAEEQFVVEGCAQ